MWIRELLAAGVRHVGVSKPLNSYLLGEWFIRRRGAAAALGRVRVVANGGNCPAAADTNWVHYVHAAYEPTVGTGMLRRVKQEISHGNFLAAEAKAMRNAKIIIANSRRTKRDLIEKLGVPESRIHVVYYGIDAELFQPAAASEHREARTELGVER